MDKRTEKIILSLLMKLKDRLAIIMVTHAKHAAKIADRIYLLRNGYVSKSSWDDLK